MSDYYSSRWEPYDEEEYQRRIVYSAPPPDADIDYDPYSYDASGNYAPPPDPYINEYEASDWETYSPDPYTPPQAVAPVTDPYQTDYLPDEAYVATLPTTTEQVTNPDASFDPGYTTDQSAGYAPRPIESFNPREQLPPNQNALGALFGGQDPYTTANPANAWLAPPPADSIRNPAAAPATMTDSLPEPVPVNQDPLSRALAGGGPESPDPVIERQAAQQREQAEQIASGAIAAPAYPTPGDAFRAELERYPGSDRVQQEQVARQQALLTEQQTQQASAIAQEELANTRIGPPPPTPFLPNESSYEAQQYAAGSPYSTGDAAYRAWDTNAFDPAAAMSAVLDERAEQQAADPNIGRIGEGDAVNPLAPLGWIGERLGEARTLTGDQESLGDWMGARGEQIEDYLALRAAAPNVPYRQPENTADQIRMMTDLPDEVRTGLQGALEGGAQLPVIQDIGLGPQLEEMAGGAQEFGTFLQDNAQRAPELLSAPQYGNVEMAAQQAYDLLTYGDPNRTVGDSLGTRAKEAFQLLPGSIVYNQWLRDNPLKLKQGMEQGYGEFAPGPRAVWELFQGQNPTVVRGLLDIGTDPTIVAPGVAGGLKGGASVVRGVGKGTGLLPTLVGKLETPLDIGAWAAGASDTVFSAGLNKVTEGDWWRRGSMNPLALTDDAQRQLEAERARDLAGGVVDSMRSQTDATGGIPPTGSPSGSGPTPPDGGWGSPRGPRVGDLRIIDTPEGESIITRAENSEVIAGPMPRAEAEAHLAALTRPVAAPRRTSPTDGPDTPAQAATTTEPTPIDIEQTNSTAPTAPRRTSPTGGPDTPSQAAALDARPGPALPAPSRVNAQGEALSPDGWRPSTIRPDPRDHTRGASNVPRLRGDPSLPREDSWVIDTGAGVRPMTVEDAQRGYDIFASPKMTTQKFDSPDGVQWRTAMFDQGLIDYVPAPRAAYQSFLDIIAPLVRKEPDAWDAIARRGDFPETTIDHARRIATGESIDDIMTDVVNRDAAASYIRRSAARVGRTVDVGAHTGHPARTEDLPNPISTTPRAPESLGIALNPMQTASDFIDRSRQPGFVKQTARAHLDEADQRQPGYWSLTTGLMLDEEQETLLRTVITKGVDRVRHRTVGELLLEYQADMTLLRRLHNHVSAGGTLSPADRARLTKLESKFKLIDPPRTDTEADAAVLAAIGRDIDINIGLRDEAGNLVSTKSKAGQALDSVLAWFRKMTLYDTFGGPAYAMLNLVGNTITAGIARPSAMIQYWMSVPKAVRKSFGSGATSWTDDMFTATGLGKTDFLAAAGRDQIKHSKDLFTTPGGRQLGKLSGMQAMRDLAVGIDAAWREAAYRNLAEPGLRGMHRELQRHAEEALVAWVNRGKSLGITTDQLREALATLPRNGQYKGEDIQTAILDLIPDGGAIPLDLMTFTDRLGRDWKAALRAMDKAAKAQTDRLAFSGAMTKADSLIGRFFLFHYWNSRASRLYVTEALRKPYLLGAYFDFMDWAQEEAEQQNAPGYLKAILGAYNSPAGATLFFNPVAFFGTMFINQETEIGDAGSQRLTDLGRLQVEGWNPTDGRLGIVDAAANGLLNLMPNPILDAAAYVSGAKGTDGRLPFDPLGSWTRAFTDLTNMASSNGVDLPWVEHDANGAPVRFPDFRITGQMVNWAAQALSDDRGNVTQTVGPRNFDATAEAEFNAHLVTAARTLNPEATDEEIAELVIAARLDPSNEVYKLGLDGINDARWELGLGVDWPAWIRVPANAAGRLLIDRAVTQVATERNALTGIPTEELSEGQQAIKAAIYAGSPASEAIDAAVDGYYAIGVPPEGEQPATAEEIGKLYANAYQTIKRGEVTNGFIVDGITYRPDDVNAMTPEERVELANAWMSETNYGGAEAWDLNDAYYTARNAYLTDHPEIEGAVAIRQITNDYPGGPELWIRDTRQINAAYDQFVATLEQQYPLGSPELIRIATGASAAKAINAEPGSMYTVYPDKTGQYQAAGTDGMSLDAYAIQRREQEAAERAAADAEFAGKSEFEQDAWDDLEKINAVANEMDRLDSYYGLVPGTSRAIYLERITTGSKARIPDAVYDHMEANWPGSWWPKENGPAEQYLVYAQEHPDNPSFEAWSEWSLAQYNAREKEMGIEAGEGFDPANLLGLSSPSPATETQDPNFVGTLPRSRATMPAPTATPTAVRPAPAPVVEPTLAPTLAVGRTVAPISLLGAANARTAPGLEAPIFMAVANGAPLTVIGERDLNGEIWAQVRFPDNNTAWIRADLLGYTD